jgi:hypothetical protein
VEPVIGPATSGRARWLAMTKAKHSRDAVRARVLPTTTPVQDSPPSDQKKPREAERREAQPSIVRAAPADVATCGRFGRGSAPRIRHANVRNASASGRARLPALHCGTRQAGRIQHRLSSRPALPETRLGGRYPFSPVSSLPSTSETGRSAGRSGTQSRPGTECKSARGHRTRSTFGYASRKRPSDEQGDAGVYISI